MKLLLLQVRKDESVRRHEFALVARCSGVSALNIHALNMLEDPVTSNLLAGTDAMIIGGSGDFLVSQGDVPEVVGSISQLILEARARAVPTLGICFGAQLMTVALGGRVELDESRKEIGSFLITKTIAADRDPVFADLPRAFYAQLGHKDHVTALPDGAVLLAESRLSPIQAYTFPNEPLYAMIIHPELDRESVLYHLRTYAHLYGVTPEIYTSIEKELRDTPEASRMIWLFLKRVVEEGQRFPID